MAARPTFMFVTCQVGAEGAVKAELADRWPAFRFAYSRPGFLTFKIPGEHQLTDDFELHSVFARTHGFSLGKVIHKDRMAATKQVWDLAGERIYDRLHVWERDRAPPGQHGFEPAFTAESNTVAQAILAASPQPANRPALEELTKPTVACNVVLDCVLVEPNEWWIGYHVASSPRSRWVGGIPPIEAPADMVSRAYLKMEEAIAWSRLPIEPGQTCAEIGSSPGGASQSLLNRGLVVTGIDPAEMDPYVLANPNFQHVKKRGADLRRREYRHVRWLMADMNVAPQYTLDTVESIVTHPEVHVEGMLLTLKLLEWSLARDIPHYLDRIRSWGYSDVRARQLAHNRQEICVAALRQRSLRHRGTRRAAQRSVPE